MNHKRAECPRTWHSLWDEMFSASAAFDSDAESDSSDNTMELESWISERSLQPSNDNGSR